MLPAEDWLTPVRPADPGDQAIALAGRHWRDPVNEPARKNHRYPGLLINRVENSGLFWHFVDLVWIFLFPILYLL